MIPTLAELPRSPRAVVLHWTAGGAIPSDDDLTHYHYIVDQAGKVHPGVPVKANMRTIPLSTPRSEYAAHTHRMNEYRVGVALAGMIHAKQGGPYGLAPITEEQTEAACRFVADLCRAWSLPVNEMTVFTHAEAESVHKVKQAGKWDITVLPWDETITNVGEWLRERVRDAMARAPLDVTRVPLPLRIGNPHR